MELTLTITNPADLSKFAGLLASFYGTAGGAVAAPVRKGGKPQPSTTAMPEAVADPAPEVVETPEAEEIQAVASSEDITPAQMRELTHAKMAADKANGAKVKAIVEALGASSISTIAENRRAEFMAQVSAL